MAELTGLQRLLGPNLRGTIGAPGDDPLDVFGIYQRRTTRTKGYRSIRISFYDFVVTNTEAQQAVRSKFASAVASWHALDPEERAFYNFRAKRWQRRGYHYFISLFMKDRL